MNTSEKYYNEVERPKVREAIKAFKSEMGREGLLLSYSVVYDDIFYLEEHIKWLDTEYVRLSKSNEPWAAKSDIPVLREVSVSKLRNLKSRLKRIEDQLNGRNVDLTDAMIECAREYPLDSIIRVVRGVSRCVSPNHEDKHPSMNCKNNFAHCHVCGWQGDVIKVYMEVHGVTFKQAVKEMQ